MNGKYGVKILGVVLLALLGSGITSKAQLIPPDPFYELDSWSFDDTNFLSDTGDVPISMANLSNPASFDGNAVQVDSTNAAWLQYSIKDSVITNLNFFEGSVEWWVSPDWNSGAGPGSFGRLIDVGAYGTNTSSSWWSVYFSPDGSSVNFSSETNGVFTNHLSVPITWSSNAWHFLAVTYNHFQSQLYVDGQLATNGSGVFYVPSASVISNGFFVGSDSTGTAQSRSCIDDMATYSYAISAYTVSNDYAYGVQLMGGGFHTDDGGGGLTPPGGGGGTNTYSGYTNTPDYGTNLWIAGVNISSNNLMAFASNTLADVAYEVQSWTDLTKTNWVSQGFFLGSETTNWTPLFPLAVSKTNNFFIGLRSWADDGSGLPLWWQLQYFGYVGVDPDALDAAGDGYTVYQKYQMGLNPNVFYTPAAPQNFTTSYNLNTGTETITWSPAPGPVTSYTLSVDNEETGQTTNITLSATNTSFTMPLAEGSPDFGYYPYGPQINETYGFAANYGTNGSSTEDSPQYAQGDPAPSAELINGADGRLCYVFQNLPSDLSAVRIYRNNWICEFALDNNNVTGLYAQDDEIADILYPPLADGSFEIPASSITNGVCELPDSQIPPYFAYDLWVQTVRSNGVSSEWTPSVPPDWTGAVYFSSKPFVDARRQIKDNLTFLLRAADFYSPLAFTVNEGGDGWYLPPLFTWPSTYVYADYYNWQLYDSQYYYGASEFTPLYDNYFYRNFLFDSGSLKADGFLNTGITGASFNDYGYNVTISNFPAYYFDAAPYVTNSITSAPSSQLTTSLSEWILPGDANVVSLSGGTWNGNTNVYGLPYVSQEIAWVSNGVSYWNTFYPGNTEPGGVSGVIYNDVTQPGFHSTGYYFARPGIDPMPEQSGFAPTNTQPLLIAGVGNSLGVAGYNNLAVTNGFSGVHGYLGQYFAGAYQINTNGVMTTNSAGIVTPMGVFSPTIPGPAALVTMPDIDTGEQGTCAVYAVSLQLDANHDGLMDSSFNGPDITSLAHPMMFWCNNNYDRWDHDGYFFTPEQDDQQMAFCPYTPSTPTPDCNYRNAFGQRVIPCTRDLDDYARLWLGGVSSNLLAALPYGSSVTLSWANVSAGSPAIDLFQAADADGGIGYQTNETVATEQTNNELCPYVGRIAPGSSIQLNSIGNTLATTHFIWCGVSNGTGGLTLTISDQHGNVLAQTTAYIQIQDIKQMYERWTVGDDPNNPPATNATLATEGLAPGVSPFHYGSVTATNTPYIMFVHGWKMVPWLKDAFAETSLKRLYWQGYQGRFGAFNWPTTDGVLAFDVGEQQGWNSAQALLNKLNDLNATYPGNVYLMAHSQGNIVAGEALRLAGTNQVVNTYLALQAAVPVHCYDPTTPVRLLDSTGINLDSGTSNRYAIYYTPGATNYFHGIKGAGAFVNYYNTNDWALTTAWEPNQDLKPDAGYTFISDGMESYADILGPYDIQDLYFPQDTYQIFSHIIEARCFALGAQANVHGAFQKGGSSLQVDLQQPPYNYGSLHIYHSAEFRSDNAQRWQFWDSVLGSFGITR